MVVKRRSFIKTAGLATASLMFPNFLKALTSPGVGQNGKILVVLQLSGGNDGLNTIIPVQNDIYYSTRPKISISRKEALHLTDEAGINPNLSFFKELYDNGELAVLNNVGYPEPNKSHFRSMDIWQSASQSNQYLNTGWLGRYLDETCSECETQPHAVEINDLLSLAMKGEESMALAFKNYQKLHKSVQKEYFKQLTTADHEHHLTSYMYKTLRNTLQSSEHIFAESQSKFTRKTYPDTEIGKDFRTTASLILSNVSTNVFYLSVGSFDTHTKQNQKQNSLFRNINEAVEIFVKDMKENGKFQDILIMTFSEFGRRVAQNASLGTDHGTANQMFFIGGGLKEKGILNPLPDLTNLDDGDLIYTEDFRKVYATILKNWLNSDDRKILGRQNGYFDFI